MVRCSWVCVEGNATAANAECPQKEMNRSIAETPGMREIMQRNTTACMGANTSEKTRARPAVSLMWAFTFVFLYWACHAHAIFVAIFRYPGALEAYNDLWKRFEETRKRQSMYRRNGIR